MDPQRAALRRETHSGQTAKTLILIGLILQAIGVLLLLGLGFAFLLFFFGAILLAFAGLGIVWLVIVYLFSYRPTGDADYLSAQTPTLVFAILSLLTLGLLSGILYIIAYVKLGDAIHEQQAAGTVPLFGTTPQYAPPAVPYYPPAASTTQPLIPAARFCPACGAAAKPSQAYCVSCGKQLPT